ncbi:MAG: nucleoside hydrolase [Chromatocurvus sp.]
MQRRQSCPAIAAAALLLLAAMGINAESENRKVILDDDGFGIAEWMVVQDPDVEVLGVTQVSGNDWVKVGVANALRALERAGRTDIPVVPGATYPLLNTEKRTELWEKLFGRLIWKGAWHREWVEETEQSLPEYHGPDVVPENLPWGQPSTSAADEVAANFLIRKVREFPGEVTIIAMGPLTNLALAQRLDPEFAKLARQLVYMGGSLNPQKQLDSVAARQFAREFVHTPRREFNIRFDPEAAAIALRAPWRKIIMVPVDPSSYTELTPELRERISAADTPIGEALAGAEPGFPLWDIIATGVWLKPELVTVSEEAFVDINTQFGPSYGDMISWTPGYEPGLDEQTQRIVREVNVAELEQLMQDLLTRQTPQGAH